MSAFFLRDSAAGSWEALGIMAALEPQFSNSDAGTRWSASLGGHFRMDQACRGWPSVGVLQCSTVWPGLTAGPGGRVPWPFCLMPELGCLQGPHVGGLSKHQTLFQISAWDYVSKMTWKKLHSCLIMKSSYFTEVKCTKIWLKISRSENRWLFTKSDWYIKGFIIWGLVNSRDLLKIIYSWHHIPWIYLFPKTMYPGISVPTPSFFSGSLARGKWEGTGSFGVGTRILLFTPSSKTLG